MSPPARNDGGGVAPAALVRALRENACWRPFDRASERSWQELVRDLTALANSGGGSIFVGVALTEPEIIERIARHTGFAFDRVRLRGEVQHGASGVRITVGAAMFPLGLEGAAPDEPSRDAAGSAPAPAAARFYFRHHGESVPGTSDDMRRLVERVLRRTRRQWLARIRQALRTPLAPGEEGAGSAGGAASGRGPARLQPVRIVTDPRAPALQPHDVEHLYPLRQKDLVRELKARLGRRFNSYDIQAIRRYHRLDERPDFVFHLAGAGRRYSAAMLEWTLDQYGRDPEFFRKARAADQQMLKLRRHKPK